MDRVSNVFREALNSFMSRRKSPLTTQMFTDLINRFPVSVELRRRFQVHVEAEAAPVTRPFGLFPGFVCEPVGRSRAAHQIWAPSPSAGKEVTPCLTDHRREESIIMMKKKVPQFPGYKAVILFGYFLKI